MNELADTIGRLLDKPVERRYLPPRAGDLRDSWADVSEARQRARLRADGAARGRLAADG